MMRVQNLIATATAFTLIVGFVGASPSPEVRKPTAEELQDLFGKDHFSPEMDAFRELMKEPPKALYFKDGDKNVFSHTWQSKGVALGFDADCRVRFITLYSGVSTDPSGLPLVTDSSGLPMDKSIEYAPFQAYKGQLPFGLTFDDTPDVIQKKLGKPSAIVPGTKDGITSAYSYPYTKGLYIHFNDYGVPGPKSKIAFLIYFVPKVKEAPKPPAPLPGTPP
jgi:hypothetical protein